MSHLTLGTCKVFGDLKDMFGDLHDDENLVQFFQEMLAWRGEIDKETCECGVNTIVGANPALQQDKPIQG